MNRWEWPSSLCMTKTMNKVGQEMKNGLHNQRGGKWHNVEIALHGSLSNIFRLLKKYFLSINTYLYKFLCIIYMYIYIVYIYISNIYILFIKIIWATHAE